MTKKKKKQLFFHFIQKHTLAVTYSLERYLYISSTKKSPNTSIKNQHYSSVEVDQKSKATQKNKK